MDKRIEMVDCEYNDLTTATNFAGHPRHSIIFQSASHTNELKAFEKSMKSSHLVDAVAIGVCGIQSPVCMIDPPLYA